MVVKRKRDSVGCKTSKGYRKTKREVDDPNNFPPGITLSDLPLDIVLKILLKLPIKSVLICKCVCKSWLSIMSNPHFGQLYVESAPISALVRTSGSRRVSRTLHLLNFDELGSNETQKNSSGGNKCGDVCSCKDSLRPNCDNHMKVEVKLKLPLRDAKMVVHTKHEARRRGKKTTRIACKPDDDKFTVANSCNGLLCLCPKFDDSRRIYSPMTLVVCNPITGEFMRLPQSENSKLDTYSHYCHGLGYLKKTNEYKVISIYSKVIYSRAVAEIHTLGTKLWRNIEYGQFWTGMKSPTCLNGSLHWLVYNDVEASILCFDLEIETSDSFPCPSAISSVDIFIKMRISFGELKGSLFICCPCENKKRLRFWTMKKYGDSQSWTEILSFDVKDLGYWPRVYVPKVAFLRQGILIYGNIRLFIYYDPQRHLLRFLKCIGTSVALQLIFHCPSFMRLKDVVKGGDIEVRNVYSWCGIFKLHEEREVLYMAKYKADIEYKGMKFQNF